MSLPKDCYVIIKTRKPFVKLNGVYKTQGGLTVTITSFCDFRKVFKSKEGFTYDPWGLWTPEENDWNHPLHLDAGTFERTEEMGVIDFSKAKEHLANLKRKEKQARKLRNI